MSKSFRLAASATIVLLLSSSVFAQNTYDVNFTSNPPTIDGVVSPGEWDDAEGPVGGWRILRQANGPTDVLNNRFQLKWDATYLYLLTESDHGAWTTNQRDEFRSGANNLNLYFDPDLDGEGNQGAEDAPFTTPDGYQIAVNQYLGTFVCLDSPCSVEHDANPLNDLRFGAAGSNLSTLAGAHIDGLFANNGGWLGMRGTQIGTVNTANGGVVEMAIPWTDFDAPNMDVNGDDPGLNIMGEAPTGGDEWLFNIAQIVNGGPSGNNLPAWNWHEEPSGGNEFFASQPHGVITFVGGAAAPEVVSVELNGGEAQRSAVETITVAFDSEATLADGAFSVVQRSTATEETFEAVTVIVADQVVGGQTIATIQFDSHVRNSDNALVDGNYQLTVNADLVTNGGTPMVEDFVLGSVEEDDFFSYYGDATGERSINVFDLLSFRTSFGESEGDPGYLFFMDFGADGIVNVFDLLQFRTRFGETMPFTFDSSFKRSAESGKSRSRTTSNIRR